MIGGTIRSYAGATLEFIRQEQAYVLLAEGDVVLGTLETVERRVMRCTTRDGIWTFRGVRGSRLEAFAQTTTMRVARYVPRWLAGGTIAFDDGPRYKLRAPAFGAGWRVSEPRRGPELLKVSGVHAVEIAGRASPVHELPLLTMLALRAILAEESLPLAGSPGGDGVVGF